MWTVFQLQEGMDEIFRRADVEAERINIPAIPRYFWRYRMQLTLEKLVQAKNSAKLLKIWRVKADVFILTMDQKVNGSPPFGCAGTSKV